MPPFSSLPPARRRTTTGRRSADRCGAALDNVDWTQIPPDNNTGIQFPVQLHSAGPLAISNVHVVQHNAANLSVSHLTLKADVTNTTNTRQRGSLSRVVGFRASRSVSAQGGARSVTLSPRATRTFSFRLVIRHPHVWWPYQMGAQPLYTLGMQVKPDRGRADSASETFAIRTMRAATLKQLERFARAGGRVIFAGDLPALVDAAPSAAVAKLTKRGRVVPFNRRRILAELEEFRDIEIRHADGSAADSILYQLRADGKRRHLFLCNTDRKSAQRNVTVTEAPASSSSTPSST